MKMLTLVESRVNNAEGDPSEEVYVVEANAHECSRESQRKLLSGELNLAHAQGATTPKLCCLPYPLV